MINLTKYLLFTCANDKQKQIVLRQLAIFAAQDLIREHKLTPMDLLERKNKPFYDRMDNFNNIWKRFFS